MICSIAGPIAWGELEQVKICGKCKNAKAISEFSPKIGGKYGVSGQCRICTHERSRRWIDANRSRLRNIRLRYYRLNKERLDAAQRRTSNPEAARKSHRRYMLRHKEDVGQRIKERCLEDPEFKLERTLRARMCFVVRRIKAGKCNSTINLIGSSIAELKKHLEGQFETGMTWENHGTEWHVDHIIPCKAFDLTKPEDQQKCFHFTNLQPLWVYQNLRKAAKYK